MNTDCPIECMSRDLICESPPDFLTKHGTFFLTLIGALGGGIGILLTYCLKSRCTKIKFCGLGCTRTPVSLNVNEASCNLEGNGNGNTFVANEAQIQM